MIIPMRCFTCNKHIADKYDAYVEKVINYSNIKSFEEYTNFKKVDNDNILSEDTPSLRAFKELGIERMCCRRMFLGHLENIVDL